MDSLFSCVYYQLFDEQLLLDEINFICLNGCLINF